MKEYSFKMWQEGDFHEAFIGFPLFHASSNAYN
jgi:hypothetical protein